MNFDEWWDQYQDAAGPFTVRERSLAIIAYNAAMHHSRCYVADDKVYPTRVDFANGRIVAYKLEDGRAFLGVGLIEDRPACQVQCQDADDCRAAFDDWFRLNSSQYNHNQSVYWHTWLAAIFWLANKRPDESCWAAFDIWYRSEKSAGLLGACDVSAQQKALMDTWDAAVTWIEDTK